MDENIIREFEGRIAKVEASTASAHKRIDDVDKLTESVYTLATETKLMRGDMNEIKGRVDVIERQPSKRWDLIVTTAITAIMSGALGYVLSILIK